MTHTHTTPSPAAATVQRSFQTLCQAYSLPRSEMLRLASWALQYPRSWFLAHDTDPLTSEQITAIEQAFARRLQGEPIAYIEGNREFYGLSLHVSPAVLIPRPETELLVDYLITNTPQQATLVDLGTGSGAIAIALAHHRADCSVWACDISEQALTVAKINAKQHAPQLHFCQGDWCNALNTSDLQLGGIDVIVSNPPYIAEHDAHLTQGDLRFEPAQALTDFADGLSHYRTIATQALTWLKPKGMLVFEHGFDQGSQLCQLLQDLGYDHITQHYDQDEQRHPRMVVAQLACT